MWNIWYLKCYFGRGGCEYVNCLCWMPWWVCWGLGTLHHRRWSRLIPIQIIPKILIPAVHILVYTVNVINKVFKMFRFCCAIFFDDTHIWACCCQHDIQQKKLWSLFCRPWKWCQLVTIWGGAKSGRIQLGCNDEHFSSRRLRAVSEF